MKTAFLAGVEHDRLNGSRAGPLSSPDRHDMEAAGTDPGTLHRDIDQIVGDQLANFKALIDACNEP
jgi:hypothetical protein